MKKKKIFIINEFGAWETIATRQINFYKNLTEAGYDVVIVSGSKIPKSDKNLLPRREKFRSTVLFGCRYLLIRTMNYRGNGLKRILASLKFQHDAMKILAKIEKPDIVISNYVGLFGNKFLKFKTKYGAQFITDVLDLWPETFVDMHYISRTNPATKVLYSLERKAYETADYCIFSFEGGKDYLKERKWDTASGGKIDLNKILYINNGVDLKQFYINKNKCKIVDNDLDAKNVFKAVYIGSISEANDVDFIVEAARFLASRGNIQIKFLIYGDGSRRESLEKKSRDLKLPNIIFKGKLPIENAPFVLSKADVNIFNFQNIPLLRFGLSPNKLFMYLAAGRPVISPVDPNYNVITKYDCGIITTHDPAIFANRLVEMSKMPEDKLEHYGRNALEAAKEFDYRKMIGEVLLPILRK